MQRTGYIDTGSGHVPSPALKRPSPLGRADRVVEVAATVRHLVGPGRRFTTGTTVHIMVAGIQAAVY